MRIELKSIENHRMGLSSPRYQACIRYEVTNDIAQAEIMCITTIDMQECTPEKTAKELLGLFGRLLFMSAAQLFSVDASQAKQSPTQLRHTKEATKVEAGNASVRIQIKNISGYFNNKEALTETLEAARNRVLQDLRTYLLAQFRRTAMWDSNIEVAGRGNTCKKIHTEKADAYIFNTVDTIFGRGADADFRRGKRKLDLSHGQTVHHCKELGIKSPPYPSAQIRALCTKYFGEEAHPEFGRFTYGSFERDSNIAS